MMRPVVAASKFSALARTPTNEPCSPWPSDRMLTPSKRTQTDRKSANIENPLLSGLRLLHGDCERIVLAYGL